jgi:hypothetical protein
MNRATNENSNQLCLILYPNMKGLGYILCESPKDLINYGILNVAPLQREYTKRLKHFVKRYKPTIIILRGYRKRHNHISKRVKTTIRNFEKIADQCDIPVVRYSREQIKEIFVAFGSTTKYEISKNIATWYPELRERLPDLRKNSKSEHYQMGIFDTFSLMITHFYLQ